MNNGMSSMLNGVFFLSGGTGLIYEVVWGRMLATVLGSTVTATSIVMGVFMVGLALGARLFGSWGDKTARPLKLYACLEAGIGISAMGADNILSRLHDWYPSLLSLFGEPWPTVLKTVIAAAILLVPTMLMGGTLPVLSRCVVKRPQNIGRPVGSLYGVNTLGALAGCLFSGFYAIERLGLLKTSLLAAGINMVIFLYCFFLLSDSPAHTSFCRKSAIPKIEPPAPHLPPRGFLLVYTVSGATGLAYEVLWIRLLSVSFIGTSYGFAAMLATCLGGMALGSLCFANKADETPRPLFWFSAMQLGIAFWGACILLPYNLLPAFQRTLTHFLGVSWASQLVEMLLFSGSLVLVPAFLFGALFPLATRIWAGAGHGIGNSVGSLYTANTLGAVTGAIAAGFFLLPNLGVQNALLFLGAVNGGIALYVVTVSNLSVLGKRRVVAVTVIFFSVLLFFVPGHLTARAMAHRLEKPWHLLYYHEGPDNNTMILQNGQTHVRRLMTTIFQYIGDDSTVMKRIQKIQAHLPILLAASPEKILFVGMGTGITPGAATAYRADITCCEISRGVMQASRFFARENKDILHNRKVTLVLEDGRHYLLQQKESFDLIVGDLYNAALAGMGNLYSREYYSLCRSRLQQGGMMCQWISMKDFPEKDLRGVMATFSSVFPHTALWCATPDILAMIGTLDPLDADLNKIEKTMKAPGLKRELREVGLDTPLLLLAHFLMNQKAWNVYVDDAPIVTDDKPYIENSIPRSLHYLHYKTEMAVTLRDVNAGRTRLIQAGKRALNPFEKRLDRVFRSESRLFEGYALFLEDRLASAREKFKEALSLNPGNMDARLLLEILEQSKTLCSASFFQHRS